MSDPTTRHLLSCNLLASAAFDYGQRVHIYGVESTWSREVEKRLRPLLIADMAPPEPSPTWTVDDADTLIRRAAGHNLALNGARDRVAVLLHDLSHDLDPTARAATEGALGVACAKLAALVGGAK